MKNLILIFFAISFIALGCTITDPVSTTNSESLNTNDVKFEDVNSPFIVDKGMEVSDTLFAGIEKGVCFGNCPVYKMNIYSRGTVMLNAIRGTKMNGAYRSYVTPDQMNLILAKAKEIKFEDMKPIYDNKSVTDLPMVKTSIVLNGKHKKVKRRYDYPKEIIELEKMFDNLLDDLEWEKIKGVSTNY